MAFASNNQFLLTHGKLTLLATLSICMAIAVIVLLGPSVMEAKIRSPWLALDLDYFAGLAAALVLLCVVFVLPLDERKRMALTGLWATKAMVALGPMLFYEAHYEVLDAYSYHEDARNRSLGVGDFGLGLGSENVTLLLQGLYSILPPSYHLAKILFAFAGLVGVYLAYRGAAHAWGSAALWPLFVVALFPGTLFWSSILGKEPLLILGIGLYVYGVGSLLRNRWLPATSALLVGVLLSIAIRVWMGAILVAPLFVLVMASHRFNRVSKIAVFAMTLVIGGLIWTPVSERLGVTDVGLVERVDVLSSAWAEGGSAQDAPNFSSYEDMVRFAPLGMFTALFRPLPGEVPTFFGVIASLENVVLLSLVALAAFRVRGRALRDPLFLMLGGVVILWAAAYGFVSYQNLGTAVRFKAQILPLLLLLVLFAWWPTFRKGYS